MNQFFVCVFCMLFCWPGPLLGQHSKAQQTSPAPTFSVSFREGEPLRAASLSPIIRLPLQCTSDGTMFLNLLQPPEFTVPTLASISPKREVYAFELKQVPDLYDVSMRGFAVSDSTVALLFSGAGERKEDSATVTGSNGATWEQKRNAADHHNYIATFDREGKFKDVVQIDDNLRPDELGVFPSGTFLLSAFREGYASEQLMLLKSDGTVLQYLNIPRKYDEDPDANPNSNESKFPAGTLLGMQKFLAVRDSLFVVNNHKRPLLQVRDNGAVRVIVPKLPKGAMIEAVIPSDEGLYLRTSDTDNTNKSLIFEIDQQDGSVLRKFVLAGNVNAAGVACVNNGAFLSFKYGEGGAFIPLTGTPETPSSSAQGGGATK